MNRYQFKVRALRIPRPLGIAFFLLITLFPFYYMILLSFRQIDQLIQSPDSIVPPLKEITLSAYRGVLRSADSGGQGFVRFLINSGLIALGTVIVTIAVSIPGAYAVSRLHFFGKRTIHFLFLSVYLFPTIILAIPLFVVFTRMGLRGSLPVLVIVYVAQTLPVSVQTIETPPTI